MEEEVRHALIVEDEVIIALGLRTIMRSLGFSQITTVGSIEELQKLRDDHFDLAIFDVSLPDGSSHKLAESFSRRGIPTIIHSGHVLPTEISLNGNMHFLAKPSSRAEIKSLIKSIVDVA